MKAQLKPSNYSFESQKTVMPSAYKNMKSIVPSLPLLQTRKPTRNPPSKALLKMQDSLYCQNEEKIVHRISRYNSINVLLQSKALLCAALKRIKVHTFLLDNSIKDCKTHGIIRWGMAVGCDSGRIPGVILFLYQI